MHADVVSPQYANSKKASARKTKKLESRILSINVGLVEIIQIPAKGRRRSVPEIPHIRFVTKLTRAKREGVEMPRKQLAIHGKTKKRAQRLNYRNKTFKDDHAEELQD